MKMFSIFLALSLLQVTSMTSKPVSCDVPSQETCPSSCMINAECMKKIAMALSDDDSSMGAQKEDSFDDESDDTVRSKKAKRVCSLVVQDCLTAGSINSKSNIVFNSCGTPLNVMGAFEKDLENVRGILAAQNVTRSTIAPNPVTGIQFVAQEGAGYTVTSSSITNIDITALIQSFGIPGILAVQVSRISVDVAFTKPFASSPAVVVAIENPSAGLTPTALVFSFISRVQPLSNSSARIVLSGFVAGTSLFNINNLVFALANGIKIHFITQAPVQ